MAGAQGAGSGRYVPARRGLGAASLLVAVVAAASTALAQGDGDKGPAVRVATTGNGSERVKTLPITGRAGAEKRVVMSLGPRRIPDLRQGDRLRVTAEMQVTVNCFFQSPRCNGPIYHYNPTVRARLFVTAGEGVTGGRNAIALGRPQKDRCTQRHPHREHHCVLVFTGESLNLRDPGRLPCELDSCHINLVASADHPNARRGEVVMVGGNRPDGSIPQDRGRINAIRFRPGHHGKYPTPSTHARRHSRVPPDFRRRVIYSQRLDGLRAGEQLAVEARLRTGIAHLPYAVRSSARLILAEKPNDPRGGRFVKRVARLRGEIAENNGFNCTQDKGGCLSRKVGVLEMRRDATSPRGKRRPLHVNLVTVFGPKVLKAKSGDRIKIRRRGGIEVTRYPPSVNR